MNEHEIEDRLLAADSDPAASQHVDATVCPECQGLGVRPDGEACPVCDGTGKATARTGGG